MSEHPGMLQIRLKL